MIHDSDPAVEAVIFRFPTVLTGRPADSAPRGAMELALRAISFAGPAEAVGSSKGILLAATERTVDD